MVIVSVMFLSSIYGYGVAQAHEISYIWAMPTTAHVISQITVNGQARPVASISWVSDVIAELNLDPRKIAIELNQTIIPRSAYGSTPVVAGDAIEIVGFIGGG